MGAVVAVLKSEAMPMHGRVHIALVEDVDLDLRPLRQFENRPGYRAVVGEHPHQAVADLLDHWRDAKFDAVAIRELDELGLVRFRKPRGGGGEVV
jgi:hypothetical protein